MIVGKNNVTRENLAKEMDVIKNKLHLQSLDNALKFPKFFQIETTQICNAKCFFCPSSEWDNDKQRMSDELFEKIVAQISKHKEYVGFVDLQKMNEPLTDKHIDKKVKLLKDYGIKHVMFSTNASLLFEDISVRLIEAGLDEIMFSIDSIEKEEYENTRIGLQFEKVVENIKNFFKLRDQLNPNLAIRVRGVIFCEPDDEQGSKKIKEWKEFWMQFSHNEKDRIYMKRAHTWGNQKVIKEHDNLEDIDVYHPCILPWSTMHISADGKVGICPNDYDTSKLYIGDVTTDSIETIWNSDKINKIRNLHSSGNRNDISLCRHCVLFDDEYSIEKHQS